MPSPTLLDSQRLFAQAIRSPQPAQALALLQGDAARQEAGLAAYRRNALLNAQQALRLAYPVLAQVVGEEFMCALARDHWQARPSRSGDLNEYGTDLADSLIAPADASGMPWLVDLARLEWAVHEAGMAADIVPLSLTALQACTPERLPTLRLRLQPAASLLASPWPIASLWQQHQPDYTGALDLDGRGAEHALVLREGWHVTVRTLRPAEAAFWRAAQADCALAQMLEQALEHDPAFDPAASLQQAFAQGLIAALH